AAAGGAGSSGAVTGVSAGGREPAAVCRPGGALGVGAGGTADRYCHCVYRCVIFPLFIVTRARLMLRVEALQIRRGGKTVLSDVTLDLLPGAVLGVLGPNGAGKSTLLGALCGELSPDEGKIWLDQQ